MRAPLLKSLLFCLFGLEKCKLCFVAFFFAPRVAFNEVQLFAFWLTALEIVEIGHALGCIFGKCDNDAGKTRKVLNKNIRWLKNVILDCCLSGNFFLRKLCATSKKRVTKHYSKGLHFCSWSHWKNDLKMVGILIRGNGFFGFWKEGVCFLPKGWFGFSWPRILSINTLESSWTFQWVVRFPFFY